MNRAFYSAVSKELYQRRWLIGGYSVAAVLFLLLYVSIYPSFQNESAKFTELFKSYPKAILEAFNIEQLNLATLSGYVSAEHFSLVWPLMAIFLALSLAGKTLAGEIEQGTMAILLALPLGRLKLFFSKYIAGLLALTLFVLVSIVAIIPLAAIFGLEIQIGNVLKVTILSLIFTLAIYCVGLAISSVVSEKSKVYIVSGGVLMIMYILNIVSGLVKSLSDLKYFSYFHFYQPDKALVHGQVFDSSFYVFGATILIATIVSLALFLRRDISV